MELSILQEALEAGDITHNEHEINLKKTYEHKNKTLALLGHEVLPIKEELACEITIDKAHVGHYTQNTKSGYFKLEALQDTDNSIYDIITPQSSKTKKVKLFMWEDNAKEKYIEKAKLAELKTELERGVDTVAEIPGYRMEHEIIDEATGKVRVRIIKTREEVEPIKEPEEVAEPTDTQDPFDVVAPIPVAPIPIIAPAPAPF